MHILLCDKCTCVWACVMLADRRWRCCINKVSVIHMKHKYARRRLIWLNLKMWIWIWIQNNVAWNDILYLNFSSSFFILDNICQEVSSSVGQKNAAPLTSFYVHASAYVYPLRCFNGRLNALATAAFVFFCVIFVSLSSEWIFSSPFDCLLTHPWIFFHCLRHFKSTILSNIYSMRK